MSPMNATTASAQDVWDALEHLPDPEIPVVSLRELGILRDVRPGKQGLEVVITPTYSGCPAMGQIEDDVRATLKERGIEATVVTQLSPAWTTDWISDATREKLRAYGIAPPQGNCASQGANLSVMQFMSRSSIDAPSIACPRCGSTHTVETSRFGSTACKSLHRCLDCSEPFDYFKPY